MDFKQKLKKITEYSLILFFLISCSSESLKKESPFEKFLANGQCKKASENIPNLTKKKIIENAKTTAGTGVSYVVTGTAYGVDLAYFLAGGLFIPAALCTPTMLAHIVGGGGAEITDSCIESIFRKTQPLDEAGERENFGKKVFERTKQLRCPDLEYIYTPILKISDCYKGSGDMERAKRQLRVLIQGQEYSKCLTDRQFNEIFQKLKELGAQI